MVECEECWRLPFPGYKICCVECLQSQGREHSIECDVRYIQQNFYTPDMHLIRVSQRPFPTYRLCHLGSNFVIQWKFFQVWWLHRRFDSKCEYPIKIFDVWAKGAATE